MGDRPKRKGSRWNLASLLLAWVRTPCQFMSLHWQEKVLEHCNAAAPDMSDNKVYFSEITSSMIFWKKHCEEPWDSRLAAFFKDIFWGFNIGFLVVTAFQSALKLPFCNFVQLRAIHLKTFDFRTRRMFLNAVLPPVMHLHSDQPDRTMPAQWHSTTF